MEPESSEERRVTNIQTGAVMRVLSGADEKQNPYGGLDQEGLDDTIEAVEAQGLASVVRCKPNQILLDLDGEYPDEIMKNLLPLIDRFNLAAPTPFMQMGQFLHIMDHWVSMSGKGLHVVIGVKDDLSWPERSCIATQLGSDPVREFLSFIRYKNGIAEPWLLFKPREPVIPNPRITDWFSNDEIPF